MSEQDWMDRCQRAEYDRDRDHAVMREFQAKFMEADHHRIALLESIAQLEARILKYQEDEASVCPEGMGFVEYIRVLTKRWTLFRETSEELGRICKGLREERDTLRERDKRSRELLIECIDCTCGTLRESLRTEIQQPLEGK